MDVSFFVLLKVIFTIAAIWIIGATIVGALGYFLFKTLMKFVNENN
jgi:hypothetical protein